MILGSESCIKVTALGLVFCIIFSLPACSDDEPVEQDEPPAETAKDKPLPVRQWYPRPKHSISRSGIVPQFSQPPMNMPPAQQSRQPRQQQQWGDSSQSYQAQPPPQPQSQWYGGGSAYQAPAPQTAAPQQAVRPYYQAPVQQQYVAPYYPQQAPQRPWGEVPPNVPPSPWSTDPAPAGQPQQGYPSSDWQQQAPGGATYPAWGTPYGGYPGTAIPGHMW